MREASCLSGTIATALHCTAALDEANLLNQLLRIGRQSAYERVAHLILELRERLAMIGFAGTDTIPVPLTQEMLADALGLSIVHLNRTLQQLRREGLIQFKSGVMRLLQPDRVWRRLPTSGRRCRSRGCGGL